MMVLLFKSQLRADIDAEDYWVCRTIRDYAWTREVPA